MTTTLTAAARKAAQDIDSLYEVGCHHNTFIVVRPSTDEVAAIIARHYGSLDAEQALQGEQAKDAERLQEARECAQCVMMSIDEEDFPKDQLWIPTIRAHAYVIDDNLRAMGVPSCFDAARHQAAQGETGKA